MKTIIALILLALPCYAQTTHTTASQEGNNVFTGTNTFTQPATFNSSLSVGGAATAQSYNNVLMVDQQAGADLAAKVTTCIGLLPATGGTCDARGAQGAQSWGSLVSFSKPVKLLLPAGTITITQGNGFSIASDSVHILGLGEDSTVINYSGTTGTVISNPTPTSVKNYTKLEDFALASTGGAGVTSTGISFSGLSNWTMKNVHVIDFSPLFFADSPAGTSTVYNSFDHNYFQCQNASSGFSAIVLKGNSNAIKFVGGNRFSRCNHQVETDLDGANTTPNELDLGNSTFELSDSSAIHVIHGQLIMTGGRFESTNIPWQCEANFDAQLFVSKATFGVNTNLPVDLSGYCGVDAQGSFGLATSHSTGGITDNVHANLARNPGLEAWSASTTAYEWRQVAVPNFNAAAGVAFNQDTTAANVHSGTSSAKITATSGRGMVVATPIPIQGTLTAAETLPHTYTFGVWWLPAATNGGWVPCFKIFDSSAVEITTGTVVAAQILDAANVSQRTVGNFTYNGGDGCWLIGANVTGSLAWHFSAWTLKLPSNAQTIQPGVVVFNPNVNNVWFDDFCFSEGECTRRSLSHFFPNDGTETLLASTVTSTGAAATLSGTGACATITTQTGGSWAGQATCTGTTGASTLTITPGISAAHGWVCSAYDQTTRANLLQQTATVAASCTLTATSVTQNDVIVFSAIAF